MPATEQTWRDQKGLHHVFAASCVVLLGATVWMFIQDHNREWKDYQKNFRRIQVQNNLWNQAQFNNEVVQQAHSQLSRKLLRIQSQPLNADLLEQFKNEVNADAKRRAVSAFDFERLNQLIGKHEEVSSVALSARKKATKTLADARSMRDKASITQVAATEAEAALEAAAPEAREEAEKKLKSLEQQAAELQQQREQLEADYDIQDKEAVEAEAAAKSAREMVIERLRTIIAAARFREKLALDMRKAKSAEYDAEKANLGLAVRDGAPPEELERLQQLVGERAEEVTALTFDYDEKSIHRKRLEEIVQSLKVEEDDMAKKLKDLNADLGRLDTAYTELRSTYFVNSFPFLGKRWLEMPILDAFNSPLKIENLWDNDNTIDYNFSRVRRFDRCTTCHQAMEKSLPGKADEPLYLKERYLELILSTPTKEELAELSEGQDGNNRALTLELVYGLRLAEAGEYLLDRDDVTISYVRPYSIDLPVDLDEDGEAEQSPKLRASSLGAQALLQNGEDDRGPVDADQLRLETLQGRAAPSLEGLGVAAGLQVGDVIVQVNDDYVENRAAARQLLLDVEWGKPVRLLVRRGLPDPYTSHPRLDLFVGSLSPHKLADFACTICHEGQGSATAFKWASHTPNNERELERWEHEYGWFDNHHWIFPMYPKRFAQSSCLKCHHDVTELRPSEDFPDPPAAKLMHGYDLIRKYGCYGCHEINGYEGPTERIGPDLRLEPNYFAAAQDLMARLPSRKERIEADLKSRSARVSEVEMQLAEKQQALDALQDDAAQDEADGADDEEEEPSSEVAALQQEITDLQQQLVAVQEESAALKAEVDELAKMKALAEDLVALPEDAKARHKLLALIERDKEDLDETGSAMLDAQAHKVADLLKDVEVPGTLRKPGPSLRFVASKLDDQFMFDWIRDPQHFRESTRMPQFFGLWDHLRDSEEQVEKTKKYEAVEILGISAYLKDRSQQFEYLSPSEDITEASAEEMAGRGKIQFQTRGCLACHTHSAFSDADAYRDPAEIVQGPDLSNLAGKFDPERNPDGRKWLYSWIKNPTRYHARTVMPDLFLSLIESTGADGQETTSDPVADIVQFLLADGSGEGQQWQPTGDALTQVGENAGTLRALAELNLRDSFSESAVKRYLSSGIPESRRNDIKIAETEMVVTDAERAWANDTAKSRGMPESEVLKELIQQKQLLYVGRKAIARLGCYGCHDIPGFESAKPIGTGLNDWGRKDPSKLAFEHILQYVEHGHGQEPAGSGHHSDGESHAENAADEQPGEGEFEALDRSFYQNALEHGHRSGFIYQKLKEPRSYDYHRTENIKYSERLRMPEFPFSDQEREAVITFVLGLVADPPATKFVYDPDPRQKSINEGRVVLEKYNCGGCHILELEKWDISFPEGHFRDPAEITTFPFMKPDFSEDEIAQSQATNWRGRIHARLVGLPTIDTAGVPIIADDIGEMLFPGEMYDPEALEYSFDLWEPKLLDGQVWPVGGVSVNVPSRLIQRRYPTNGGMLAKYLVPQVVQLERDRGGASASKGKEAWGWVPPPLVGEGAKVQTEWLHDFLLDPHGIRPAAVLRMPKFNMSPAEATKLVNYFAATDNADYPYEYEQRRRSDHLADAQAKFQSYLESQTAEGGAPSEAPDSRFEAAMNIVVDKNYCRQCHIVADYDPGGDLKAKAPNLADVYTRLRPDYVRRWIARPMQILPYTGMPENVKYNPQDPVHLGGVSQELYPGTSIDQIDGLVDLLMNFDRYAKDKLDITSLVQERAAAEMSDAAENGEISETDMGE